MNVEGRYRSFRCAAEVAQQPLWPEVPFYLTPSLVLHKERER